MVSKARLDLPDPERPVMVTSAFRGSETVTSLRLCSRAPWTTRASADIEPSVASERTFALRVRRAAGGAPRPVRPVLDQTGPDRVRQHVLECAAVVLLVADDPRREARSEDVAVAVVPSVEALGVLAVQVLHAR